MGRPYRGGGSRGLCRGQDSPLLKVGKTQGGGICVWRPKVAMMMCGVECLASIECSVSSWTRGVKDRRGGVSPCTEKSVAASALRLCVVCVCVYGHGSCIGAIASEEDEASGCPTQCPTQGGRGANSLCSARPRESQKQSNHGPPAAT